MPKSLISHCDMESRGWRMQEYIADENSQRLTEAGKEFSNKRKYRAYKIVPAENLLIEPLRPDFKIKKGYIVYVKHNERHLRELRERREGVRVDIPINGALEEASFVVQYDLKF